ncbi:hypothetical protein [Stieleria maiorica]|uniref:hypothetical protein n=1 Tax=Stieleria maiorica TaxID=2795974 RepID=UPI0011C95802|nr:hypothetical protein [Stieleria maiorica]
MGIGVGANSEKNDSPTTAALSRQGISPVGLAIAWFVLLLASAGNPVRADLFDSLDAYPPRLHLDTSDCDARVIEHKNMADGGVDGGGCESMTFQAGVGSEAILVYPLEPIHAINDLVATLSIMSARHGARVGLRVRFPFLRDPQTRRPLSAILYGATYQHPGKFQSLGIGNIERELRIKIANLRAVHGSDANLDNAYIDAMVINAYSGPGTTTLRIDQVSVRGMIPVGDHGRVDVVPTQAVKGTAGPNGREVSIQSQRLLKIRRPVSDQDRSGPVLAEVAFPQNNVIRVLEHRGEPLTWIRSLGFDAVLLSHPPTADLLRDAIQSQMLVYAPPPIAPDPALGPLLDPVMAWYLGGGVALDNSRVSQTDKTVRRLRMFPAAWQRPIVISPVERWASYGAIADAIVSDAALRSRGLSVAEQALIFQDRRARIGSGTAMAIAIESSPPNKLALMNRSISAAIGAPPGGNFRWHSMLTQVVQSLEQTPCAIVFRSQESLASGTMFAHQRSMALSYINRFVAMLGPWIASSRPAAPYPIRGAAYRCGRLDAAGDQFLLLTSDQTTRDQVLAGDGRAVEILLPPEMVHRTAWRLTSFSAERIDIDSTPTGARIEIVSPDVAEVIVVSADSSLAARLDQSARRFAVRAASDRWQLCGDQVRQVRQDWDHAVSSGATQAIMPVDLLTAARRTLEDAERVYRAGDAEATLRLSRRADAWAVRSRLQLSQALLSDTARGTAPRYISSPPIDEGRPTLQTAWQPLMGDEGWSDNLIASGGLDRADVLSAGGWAFGQRTMVRAESNARWISRGFFSGKGAVALSAAATTGESLGGGYEGTIAILSSPTVRIQPTQAVRVDAMIRTIGFGGPHQGVLVYDSLGGQEMGVLVRGATDWTPVRLYRQSVGETEVRVMFEVIGDGEAVVDEVAVRVWDPEPLPELPLHSITP